MKIINELRNRVGTILLATLSSLFVPMLLWAAAIAAFWQMLTEWRVIRTQLFAGNVACSIDTDCPSGYECIGGRCLSRPVR